MQNYNNSSPIGIIRQINLFLNPNLQKIYRQKTNSTKHAILDDNLYQQFEFLTLKLFHIYLTDPFGAFKRYHRLQKNYNEKPNEEKDYVYQYEKELLLNSTLLDDLSYMMGDFAFPSVRELYLDALQRKINRKDIKKFKKTNEYLYFLLANMKFTPKFNFSQRSLFRAMNKVHTPTSKLLHGMTLLDFNSSFDSIGMKFIKEAEEEATNRFLYNISFIYNNVTLIVNIPKPQYYEPNQTIQNHPKNGNIEENLRQQKSNEKNHENQKGHHNVKKSEEEIMKEKENERVKLKTNEIIIFYMLKEMIVNKKYESSLWKEASYRYNLNKLKFHPIVRKLYFQLLKRARSFATLEEIVKEFMEFNKNQNFSKTNNETNKEIGIEINNDKTAKKENKKTEKVPENDNNQKIETTTSSPHGQKGNIHQTNNNNNHEKTEMHPNNDENIFGNTQKNNSNSTNYLFETIDQSKLKFSLAYSIVHLANQIQLIHNKILDYLKNIIMSLLIPNTNPYSPKKKYFPNSKNSSHEYNTVTFNKEFASSIFMEFIESSWVVREMDIAEEIYNVDKVKELTHSNEDGQDNSNLLLYSLRIYQLFAAAGFKDAMCNAYLIMKKYDLVDINFISYLYACGETMYLHEVVKNWNLIDRINPYAAFKAALINRDNLTKSFEYLDIVVSMKPESKPAIFFVKNLIKIYYFFKILFKDNHSISEIGNLFQQSGNSPYLFHIMHILLIIIAFFVLLTVRTFYICEYLDK
ncbi:hypothetical protein TRFO_23155 [Tritrichomonas foetus]|uniref:Uncharacterized protein n=1 Tax=Tritrichomonas foetus TaxID=1144522 RepID=A0A1J4KGC0_9EUKA|nr:hypothetical protein TRFO_23155 [Tritrichomonas foetus]|eukprot:OHT08389.1 hypothetical protein TRFO_23155 [Tritrichomonas foetus]